MTRDWMFGVSMAVAVAVYPNLIDAVLYLSGLDDIGSKSWLIFFATAGPALTAPVMFGVRTDSAGESGQALPSVAGFLCALAISGVVAASYFFAVVGFGNQAGLGAGVAEIIDSSFFPVAYVGWLWLVSIAARRGAPFERPPLMAIIGAIVICAGLVVLGTAARLDQGQGPAAQEATKSAHNLALVCCALVGAAATAIALWLLRRLVRTKSVTLGTAIALRYGAPALACLFFATWRSGCRGLGDLGWTPGLVSFAAGAVLINSIYLAAVRIQSDVVQAAAMGLVPLFAVAIERAGGALSLLRTRAKVDNLAFWIGAAVAVFGIVLVWRDPGIKRS